MTNHWEVLFGRSIAWVRVIWVLLMPFKRYWVVIRVEPVAVYVFGKLIKNDKQVAFIFFDMFDIEHDRISYLFPPLSLGSANFTIERVCIRPVNFPLEDGLGIAFAADLVSKFLPLPQCLDCDMYCLSYHSQ